MFEYAGVRGILDVDNAISRFDRLGRAGDKAGSTNADAMTDLAKETDRARTAAAAANEPGAKPPRQRRGGRPAGGHGRVAWGTWSCLLPTQSGYWTRPVGRQVCPVSGH